jgi:hypothetical protein
MLHPNYFFSQRLLKWKGRPIKILHCVRVTMCHSLRRMILKYNECNN